MREQKLKKKPSWWRLMITRLLLYRPPDWLEMGITAQYFWYLMFIFFIFLFMQTFYLYKAAYQYQSTMENRLGQQISEASDAQYSTLADHTIIQVNLFFSIFLQLIKMQSIIINQRLSESVLIEPSENYTHPLTSSGLQDYSSILFSPTGSLSPTFE